MQMILQMGKLRLRTNHFMLSSRSGHRLATIQCFLLFDLGRSVFLYCPGWFGIHYVTRADLKFIAILLPRLPECYDYRHGLQYLVSSVVFLSTQPLTASRFRGALWGEREVLWKQQEQVVELPSDRSERVSVHWLCHYTARRAPLRHWKGTRQVIWPPLWNTRSRWEGCRNPCPPGGILMKSPNLASQPGHSGAREWPPWHSALDLDQRHPRGCSNVTYAD